MKPRHTKSLDGNHAEITAHLRSHGIEVKDFAGAGTVPDLLTYANGRGRWLEVKVPGGKASYTHSQLEYVANTKMDVAFITTKEDAKNYAVQGIGRLTQKQKDSIAAMLYRNPTKKAFTVNQVKECLA